MTTIKSVFEHSPATLLVESGKHEGEVYFRTNHGSQPYGDAMVSRAEVINALGAVDKVELANTKSELELTRSQYVEAVDVIGSWKARAEAAEAKLAGIDEMGCGCDEADENLRKVQAERDELAATIERVRALLPDLDAVIPYDHGNAMANRVGELIRAALDPKPAFVLPTEAGAKFTAVGRNAWKYTFTTARHSGGLSSPSGTHYVSNGHVIYSAEQVMATFTGHRLLDGDA